MVSIIAANVPDVLSVPWWACAAASAPVGAALTALWRRNQELQKEARDREIEVQKYLFSLMDRYHQVVIALNQAIKFENPDVSER